MNLIWICFELFAAWLIGRVIYGVVKFFRGEKRCK